MLAAERRELLLTRLRTDGKVVAKEIAGELGLSEDSIRRDLRELATAGLCQRVYGGAVPASRAMADYETRESVEPHSKRAVAQFAATLLQPGCVAIVDGGTTTRAVVRALPKNLECTIITHSPTIAVELMPYEKIEVIMLGGRLFRHSVVTCGAVALESAAQVSADLFLLGVTGVHPQHGFTTGDADEAAMKRGLAARAGETYVLASREKLGAASPFSVISLNQATAVVTDGQPHEIYHELASQDINIIGPNS